MAKAVFTTRVSPSYKDVPEHYYHFGRTYLRQAEAAVGDMVIYYEPRRTGLSNGKGQGRQAYFAIATVLRIRPDPELADHFYADVENYLDFDRPVPFRLGDTFLESALQREGGQTSKGAFGRSVRVLPEHEFAAICSAGYPATAQGEFTPIRAPEFGFAESDQTPYERPIVQTLISRPFREESFRRHVRAAYDNRCAVTGLRLINGGGRPEVQAAHIMPVASHGPDSVRNGLALSGTVHWLFDRGLISIADDLSLIAPVKLIPDALGGLVQHGRPLFTPRDKAALPHRSFIEHHRNHVFKG
ncbi:HNH endonuclease [Bosea sp. LjRoot237]|uniref:HNH endonuclease n=1 Tax=Bosea sp. LjRoot237 TaxID=3342292 RepID=UPI003ECD100B